MTTYYFACKTCRSKFEVEQPEPSRNVHLLLGLLTLGLWLVIYSFYQMFYFYRLSKCEDCGKRSKKLLTLLIVSAYLTVEIRSGVYYFLEIAPAESVRSGFAGGSRIPAESIRISTVRNSANFVGLARRLAHTMPVPWEDVILSGDFAFGMETI